MKYYVATNTGKGFITHEENEANHIAGYPADVYVTENTTWAARVGATEKTKEEAQSLVDTEIAQRQKEVEDRIASLEDGEEKTRLQEQLQQQKDNPVVLP